MNRYLPRASRFNRHQTTSKLRTASRPIVEPIEQRILLSSISGTVFNDANRNDVQDKGEQGLAGWTVYVDLSNTGQYKSGDPMTTTNSSGQYAFSSLGAGTFIVRALPPSGWTQTMPVDNYGQHVTVSAGGVATGENFGFYHAPIVVNTTADSTDPITSTTVSLRDAVSQADAAMGPVSITFSPTVFTAAKTITLSKGELELSDKGGPVSITGMGAGISISGNDATRVFLIDAGVTATLSALTITAGEIAPTTPVASNTDGGGGGVYNAGTLTLINVIVSDCSADAAATGSSNVTNSQGQGAGIYSTGTVTLQDCNVTGNTATGADDEAPTADNSYGGPAAGGGIYSTGPLTITGGTFIINNIANGGDDEPAITNGEQNSNGGSATGGGIYCSGPLTITGSTVVNNGATGGSAGSGDSSTGGDAIGGGIFSSGTFNVSNSAINGNGTLGGAAPVGQFPGGIALSTGGSSWGGGVFSSGSITITATIFAGNGSTGGAAGQSFFDGFGGDAAGGGLYATGTVNITSSNLLQNGANGGELGGDDSGETAGAADGGAIYCSGPTTLQTSTVSQNHVQGGSVQSWGAGGDAAGAGIYATGALVILNSTMSGNNADGGASAGSPEPLEAGLSQAQGGGLFCAASLTLTSSTVSANTAVGGDGIDADTLPPSEGGGIFVAGAATITQSTVTGNSVTGGSAGNGAAPAYGGGIDAEGSTIVSFSTVAGNTATGGSSTTDDQDGPGFDGNAYGGGIYIELSTLHLLQSTVSNNTATGGNAGDIPGINGFTAETGGFATGGIYEASGTIRLIDSTVADNAATGGTGGPAVVSSGTAYPGGYGGDATGGILAPEGLQIYDSTISGNSATGGAGGAASSSGGITAPAGHGGGAWGGIDSFTDQDLLDNTIVAGNKGNGAFVDLNGAPSSASANNLLGINTGVTNGVNGNKVGVTNPLLSPLGNYGGPTQTMYPLAGSPALGAGSTALIPAGYTTDQRGLPRVVSGKVDIGAVEFSQVVITGSVYNDLNGDGVRQTSEPGLVNWQVYVDLNDSGVYVVGDPVATTNAQGNYTLTFSPITVPGTLIVREVRQSAWRRTQPAGNYPLGYYSISPTAGTASNINFGNSLTNLVTGTVFHDVNGNGVQDTGDAGLAGWVVEVDSYVNGKWDNDATSATTNSSGVYQLILGDGTYRLHDVLKSGLKPTVPSTGQISLVLTTGLTDTGENFGNR